MHTHGNISSLFTENTLKYLFSIAVLISTLIHSDVIVAQQSATLNKENIANISPMGVNVNELYLSYLEIISQTKTMENSAIAYSKNKRAGVRHVYNMPSTEEAVIMVLKDCEEIFGNCEIYSKGSKIIYDGPSDHADKVITLNKNSRHIYCATQETVYRSSPKNCLNKHYGSPYSSREKAALMRPVLFGEKSKIVNLSGTKTGRHVYCLIKNDIIKTTKKHCIDIEKGKVFYTKNTAESARIGETDKVYCVTQLDVLNITKRGCETWYSGTYFRTLTKAQEAFENISTPGKDKYTSGQMYCVTDLGVLRTTSNGCTEWHSGNAFASESEANKEYDRIKKTRPQKRKKKRVISKEIKPWDGIAAVERPKMHYGDSWIYRGYHHKHHKDEYTVKIVSSGANGVTMELSAKRDGDYGTRFINKGEIDTVIPTYSKLDFPLTVGKFWKDSVVSTSVDNYKYHYLNEYKVLKVENKKVKAGTFKTLKIRMRQKIIEAPGHTGVMYLWYAPDVKKVILVKPSWRKGAQLIDYTLAK